MISFHELVFGEGMPDTILVSIEFGARGNLSCPLENYEMQFLIYTFTSTAMEE